MYKLHKKYNNGAVLLLMPNHEVHIAPSSEGRYPASMLKDYRKLVRELDSVYTRTLTQDRATHNLCKRVGLKEVKRDFAFAYFELEDRR